MERILFSIALAGCGEVPQTLLQSDVHYSVAWHPWSTMDDCLKHETPDACSVPLALSLCESGRAVYHKDGSADVGTYSMDTESAEAPFIASIVTQRYVMYFDVDRQSLYGDSNRWNLNDSLAVDCAP